MIKPCTTHYIGPLRVCFESDEVLILMCLKERELRGGVLGYVGFGERCGGGRDGLSSGGGGGLGGGWV